MIYNETSSPEYICIWLLRRGGGICNISTAENEKSVKFNAQRKQLIDAIHKVRRTWLGRYKLSRFVGNPHNP
jgi:hypothetical protein